MNSKKFEQIIAESPYHGYFVKVQKGELAPLWNDIEANTFVKLPLGVYKSVRERGFAVAIHGTGLSVNLYVLLSDWSAWKSKKPDTPAALMPKVEEIEKYLTERSEKKKGVKSNAG